MYQTSGDIWLESSGDRIAVENVMSGRRLLLSPAELEVLERYASPLPGLCSTAMRLHQADLVVGPDAGGIGEARKSRLIRGVDKFLAECWGVSSREAAERAPVSRRLELCLSLCEERLRPEQDEARRDVRSLFRLVEAFLDERPGGFAYQPGVLSRLWRRPPLEFGYGQLPCMPESTQRRVDLAPSLQGRCLVLGDDDLVGLAWSLRRPEPCDLFELDERLLSFLSEHELPGLRLLQRDLTGGLPVEFHHRYGVIFTDPMYGREGMDMFLTCCSQGLLKSRRARLYLTTRPDLIEDGEQLPERLARLGLEVVQVRRNFSRYRLPDTTRSLVFQTLSESGMPPQLLRSLLRVPYYYADMLEVTWIE